MHKALWRASISRGGGLAVHERCTARLCRRMFFVSSLHTELHKDLRWKWLAGFLGAGNTSDGSLSASQATVLGTFANPVQVGCAELASVVAGN